MTEPKDQVVPPLSPNPRPDETDGRFDRQAYQASQQPYSPPSPASNLPPVGYPYHPYMPPVRRKSKFLAAMLAICIPGVGHFYLGLMQRGMMVMLAVILDIFAIVQMSVGSNPNVPLITLFALLLPVIYFYNIFDTLQSADRINLRPYPTFGEGTDPFAEPNDSSLSAWTRGNRAGWLLIGVGALFFFLSRKPEWLTSLVDTAGSYVGAVILIACGAYLFLRKNKES